MKTTYDPEADAMYIYIKEDEVETTKPIDKNIILDFNKKGEVIGIEILWVKERVPDLLKILKIKMIA